MHNSFSTELWLCPEYPVSPGRAGELCESVLAPDELQRLVRLRIPADRQRFVLARLLMRRALGQHLDQEPAALRFTTTEYGKPVLAPGDAPVLHFNLSHTPGMLALALSWRGEVGVDVEAVTRRVELQALARRYFSDFENKALDALDEGRRREHFFCCWTLKEAWVKAKGLGLRLPLDAFWFELENGEGAGGGAGAAEAEDDRGARLCCGPGLQETPEDWRFRCYSRGAHRLALAQRMAPEESFGVRVRELLPGWLEDKDAFR